VAIASKLRVVGGSGAVTTLQAATGSNTNTTGNTTAQASNNKPNANTSTSTNNRANSGEVLNTQNSGNQTSSANNSTYVPSLPTPRTNSGNANTTTASTTNNSSTVVANNTGSNTANTSATRTNSHTTANNNTNATARVNNQANTVQTAQNTQARPTSAPAVSQNKPNTDVPYVGNAIATVNLAVNFGNDSDKLSVKDKTLLKELAQALNSTELRQAEFAIVGHTNSTGPYLRNLELSCARAIAVRNHLINLGVKGKRLTPYGFGPDRPLANMAAQEVANRRVEISRAK
jgi:outer membrane protein OmpA-like peptidoglycan-associated protein